MRAAATCSQKASSASHVQTPDKLLRVDAERIDSVFNLVGELILAKSMLQQTLVEFGQRFPKEALRGKFTDAMAFQARVLNDLQHSVMKIRMVPVDQLFRRFPRTVRDVARQCGKEVELVVRGGQTPIWIKVFWTRSRSRSRIWCETRLAMASRPPQNEFRRARRQKALYGSARTTRAIR